MPTKLLVSHDRDFLERVSRSACYFSDTLGELFAPLLSPTRTATIGNKAAMKRYANAVAELEQGYHSKKLLLEKIAAQGFSTATYLKAKQLSMLEARNSGASPTATSTTRRAGR